MNNLQYVTNEMLPIYQNETNNYVINTSKLHERLMSVPPFNK